MAATSVLPREGEVARAQRVTEGATAREIGNFSPSVRRRSRVAGQLPLAGEHA
jgi:hypothetical protein